jgi:Protein of unknown function (DUF3095)
MGNESFYIDLPVVDNFIEVSDSTIYTELPSDWHVAITDVKDSTKAIEQGGYKIVNLLGASSIIALLNLKKSFSFPFIFGGDGASICIPDQFLTQARGSLIATQSMAKDLFDLELRAGIVPVWYIRQCGYNVLVARYRISKNYVQAVFSGGGLQFAEDCIKDSKLGSKFSLQSAVTNGTADFSGLECRWKNVPSAHGEIVTVIVQALDSSLENRNLMYRDLILKIEEIYGTGSVSHPLREQNLSMSLSENELFGESDIRSYAKGKYVRLLYWIKIRWNVLLGKYFMTIKYRTGHTDWGQYKHQLVENTDYKKFDDKLRQVLSGTIRQREELVAYLEKQLQIRNLVYGLHTADSALITCLIFNYNGAHVHLVDADNGGYAVAASQLKKRLKEIIPDLSE